MFEPFQLTLPFEFCKTSWNNYVQFAKQEIKMLKRPWTFTMSQFREKNIKLNNKKQVESPSEWNEIKSNRGTAIEQDTCFVDSPVIW